MAARRRVTFSACEGIVREGKGERIVFSVDHKPDVYITGRCRRYDARATEYQKHVHRVSLCSVYETVYESLYIYMYKPGWKILSRTRSPCEYTFIVQYLGCVCVCLR